MATGMCEPATTLVTRGRTPIMAMSRIRMATVTDPALAWGFPRTASPGTIVLDITDDGMIAVTTAVAMIVGTIAGGVGIGVAMATAAAVRRTDASVGAAVLRNAGWLPLSSQRRLPEPSRSKFIDCAALVGDVASVEERKAVVWFTNCTRT